MSRAIFRLKGHAKLKYWFQRFFIFIVKKLEINIRNKHFIFLVEKLEIKIRDKTKNSKGTLIRQYMDIK